MTDKISKKTLYIEEFRLIEHDCVLNNYEDMPEKLYLRSLGSNIGKSIEFITDIKSNKQKRICIIGARRHTAYGVLVVKELIKELAQFNPIIISGLATGIDTIALETAIEYKLNTIAVIGSGLDDDSIYPRENILLTHLIENSGGVIISEYEIGTKAKKWHFPQRNRIMAGLADIIIIIEGSRKSGTLITARLGLDYGKEIICIPGSIFSPLSQGPLSLIEQGATPLNQISDISNFICLDKTQLIYEDSANITAYEKDINLKSENNSQYDPLIIRDRQFESEKYYSCSEEEKSILDLLYQPLSKQKLLEISQYKLSALQVILIQLEIKGFINEKYGKIVRV